MTTITKTMISSAALALIDRGYELRHPSGYPDLVWLQAPGPMPGSNWWPICQMSRTKAWNLIWSLYEQEMQS
tara:strand:+ start:327 stop:542 length:216 start_codon:yes stop_codon:yes gene_type:complete